MSTQLPTDPSAPSHPLNSDRPPLWPYASICLNLVLGGVLLFALPADTDDPRDQIITGATVAEALDREDPDQHDAIVTAVIDHLVETSEMVVAAVKIEPALLQINCPPTAHSYFDSYGNADYYGLPMAQDPPNFSDYLKPGAILPPDDTMALPDDVMLPNTVVPGDIYWSDYPEPGWHTFNHEQRLDDLALDQLLPNAPSDEIDLGDPGCPGEEVFEHGDTAGQPQSLSRHVGEQGPQP